MRKTILGSLKRRGLSFALLACCRRRRFLDGRRSRHAGLDRLRVATRRAPSTTRTAGAAPARTTTRSTRRPRSPRASERSRCASRTRSSAARSRPDLLEVAGERGRRDVGRERRQVGRRPAVVLRVAVPVHLDDRRCTRTGAYLTVSPDRGDGARMSWVKISDTPTGLALQFSEYKNGGWVYTPIASDLDRTQVHTLKLTMQFVDGPANDIVNVFVDGAAQSRPAPAGRSTSAPSRTTPTRTVDSLLFRTGGACG